LDECDKGVRELAKACGWSEELEEHWGGTAQEAQPQETKTKTTDEEVDELSREVEEALKLNATHKAWIDGELSSKDSKLAEEKQKKQMESEVFGDGDETKLHEPSKKDSHEADRENGGTSGLGHVFPHLGKKSSL